MNTFVDDLYKAFNVQIKGPRPTQRYTEPYYDVLSIKYNLVTVVADRRTRKSAFEIADHLRLTAGNDGIVYAIEPHGCFSTGDIWEVPLS